VNWAGYIITSTIFVIFGCYVYKFSYTKASTTARKWGTLVLFIHLCGGGFHILRNLGDLYTAPIVVCSTCFTSGALMLTIDWFKERRANDPECIS